MSGVNKAIIIGNVGRDPEVRYTTSGNAVANFSVATTERWKDHDGEQQERTEWHNVVFFGKVAEIAGEYVKKGRLVYVEGKLQTDKYTDKEGVERYTTKIVGLNLQLLGKREDGERGEDDRPARSTSRKPADAKDDFDDDIPF